MSSDTFEEASEAVRRLMEVAGGSCDAYAEPPAPAAPPKKNYRVWEEDVESSLLHTPPDPDVPRTSPDWIEGGHFVPPMKNDGGEQEPTRDDLDEFIRESMGFEAAPKQKTPPSPVPEQEVAECAGVIQEYRGESAHPPITNEYKLLSSVDDAGELLDLFTAFQEAVLNGPEEIQVKMGSGTYTLYNKPGRVELIDDVKGIRYVKADIAEMNHYAPIVEEEDLFIWVIPTPEYQQGAEDHLGYIHNGWAYGRK